MTSISIDHVKISKSIVSCENKLYLSIDIYQRLRLQVLPFHFSRLYPFYLIGILRGHDRISNKILFTIFNSSNENIYKERNEKDLISSSVSSSALSSASPFVSCLILGNGNLTSFLDLSHLFLDMDENGSRNINVNWYKIPQIAILHIYPIALVSVSDKSNKNSKLETDLASIQKSIQNDCITYSSIDSIRSIHTEDSSLLLRGQNDSLLLCQVSVDLMHTSQFMEIPNHPNHSWKVAKISSSTQILMYHSEIFYRYMPVLYSTIRLVNSHLSQQQKLHHINMMDYVEDSLKLSFHGILSSLHDQTIKSGNNNNDNNNNNSINDINNDNNSNSIHGIHPLNKNLIKSLLVIGESGSGTFTILSNMIESFTNIISITISPYISMIGNRGIYDINKSFNEAFQSIDVITTYHPCVLIIDNLHSICGNNDNNNDEDITSSSQSVINMLIRKLKILSSSSSTLNHKQRFPVLIIGCTYNSSLIDSMLFKSFDEKIYLSHPNPPQRQIIAKRLCYEYKVDVSDKIVKFTESISGKPLLTFINLLEHYIKDHIKQNTLIHSTEHTIPTTLRPLKSLKLQLPLYLSYPRVIGLIEVKKSIEEAVVWPKIYPNLFQSFGLSSEVGLLLFGPPGSGKTLLPQILSKELKYTLLNIRLTEVVRGEIGTGEQALVQIFHEAKRCCPSIIFIDEFQAIFTDRSDNSDGNSSNHSVGYSLSSTLSYCIDDIYYWNRNAGILSSILLICSTNEPWAIDKSFLRSGRIDRKIFVGPLSKEDRIEYCTLAFHEILSDELFQNIGNNTVVWDRIIEIITNQCDRYTGADMKLLFKRIKTRLLLLMSTKSYGCGSSLPMDDERIEEACKEVLSVSSPSISMEELNEYIDWLETF